MTERSKAERAAELVLKASGLSAIGGLLIRTIPSLSQDMGPWTPIYLPSLICASLIVLIVVIGLFVDLLFLFFPMKPTDTLARQALKWAAIIIASVVFFGAFWAVALTFMGESLSVEVVDD
ncbi:MAG: hypothetical protein HUJ27_07125 [Rhodobacteraceae bacterium]|nr:hypothetical protein [Paracoccaceae bacterium]